MFPYIKKNKLISLIIFIALVVRVVGLIPGHNYYHADEPMSYGSATDMIIHGDINPRRFDYPSGVPLLHYLFYNEAILPVVYFKLFFLHPKYLLNAILNPNFIAENQVYIFGPGALYALYWSRFLTAILGTASVVLTYIVGKKLFGKIAGLAGAFFLAFNYRHVLSSHLALSDIPNSFFVFLSFYISFLLLEKNTRNRYLLAGLSVGLSFSMKYQVLALFPFLFAHFFWVFKKGSFKYLFNKNFILGLFLIPLVFCVLNPYLLLNLKTAIPIIKFVGARYGAGIYRFNFYPLLYLFRWGIGEVAFVFIVLGMILGIFRKPFKSLFIYSYVAPFLFVFLYYMNGGSFIRNFTTVMPFLALFFAYFFAFLFNLTKRWIYGKSFWLVISVLIAVNLPSIKNTIILSLSYTKPWNISVLGSWVAKNLPKNVNVIVDDPGISPPVAGLNLIKWDHAQENSIAELQKDKIDFATLNLSLYQIYLFWFDMPIPQLLRTLDIPYRELNDSYYGLSFSEFKDYTVKEIYKPWQSPDDSNLVIKIPKKSESLGSNVASYDFNSGLEGWKYYDFSFKKGDNDFMWGKQNGRNFSGAMELLGGMSIGEISRAISPFIRVKPGNLYAAKALVKPKAIIPATLKDGFLRIDFFEKNDIRKLREGGIKKAVSERVYGSDWFEEEVSGQAPSDAQYMTVSFQRANPSRGNGYFIDDIQIRESDTLPKEPFKNLPYIKTTITGDIMYPNSVY